MVCMNKYYVEYRVIKDGALLHLDIVIDADSFVGAIDKIEDKCYENCSSCDIESMGRIDDNG